MHNFQMNINEYLPLRDVVFYTLRQAILKGELEPGERLMEMQLAEQLGVNQTTVSKWCTNTTQPDLATLKRISELLNVNVSEIINFD